MRCKRHTVDPTSTIGVCSSCLRERLLSLAASAAIEEDNNKNNRPAIILPRSVSPYVTKRKSDTNNKNTTQTDVVGISCKDFEPTTRSEKPKKRFSNLFRTRSEDLHESSSTSSSTSSSRSWISSFLLSKKQPMTCHIEDVIASKRSQRVFCRGMSPEEEEQGEVTETRRTPLAMKTPGRGRFGKSMAGMAFCLSPLVRASPNCPFKRKGRFGNSGEVMTEMEKPHISAAASFCANRSKKLVDLGRVNPRR